MGTYLQPYRKSILPPILDSYLPVNYRHQQMIKTENQKKKDSQALSGEKKEELIKKALQEQHYLETYNNLYKLRNILRERYRTLLNEKVEKQRRQIQLIHLRSQNQFKRKAKKHIPHHKMPFCKLSHNTKYLESVPQSSNYLIIGLQNELTKLGIIKTQQDYEKVWNLVQEGIHGSKFKEKLPSIKTKMFAVKSLLLSTSARTNQPQPVNDSTNRSRLRKSAGTCQLPAYEMSKQMSSQQETDQIFPQLLLSWLSEMQKMHGEPSKTQQVVTSSAHLHQDTAYKKRIKGELRLHYLRNMYYFSLVNMALSKRLLEQNGQFSDIRKEEFVHDMMEYLYPNEHKGLSRNQNKKDVGGEQQEKRHRLSSRILRIPKEKKMTNQERAFVEIPKDRKCNITTFGHHQMICAPLTLEDVALHNPVVESRPSGNYWMKYFNGDSINSSEKYQQ